MDYAIRGGQQVTSSKFSFLEKCLLWYFPLDTMYILLGMRGIDTHLILPLQALVFFYGFIAFFSLKKINRLSLLVIFYIVLSVFSVVFIPSGDRLIEGYINDMRVVVLPMLAIFIGMNNHSDKLYKVFVYAIVISMIIGLLLYFFKPDWFIQRMVEKYNNEWFTNANATDDSIMSGQLGWTSRFAAIYGSPYGVSYFGTFALCLLTVDIFKDEEHRLIKKRWIQIGSFIVLAISAVLCQNRVAIVYLAFLLMFGMFYGIKHKRKEGKLFRNILIGVLLIGTIVIIRYQDNDFVTMIKETLIERFVDTQENGLHNTSRDTQVRLTLNSWDNFVLGEGLGSRGGVARSQGKPGVTDNGYVKLIVEQGIFGFIILLLIFLTSIFHAFKHRKYLYAEMLILGYVLFTMIGANPLGMEYDYMIIMWFSLGHIWNNGYLQDCKMNNNHI